MEDFGDTREETFDELVTKHTRRELEELALKYGVENLGGTKSQLADAILEAIKKQKDRPKAAIQASPKEAPMVEKPKPAAKLAGVGKKGVMAKAAAMNSKATELHKAGTEIREQGIREMTQGVNAQIKENREAAAKIYSGAREIQSQIDSQIKENHEAAAKIHSGAREIQSSQEKMSREFQKAGRDIRDFGYKNLQNGLNQFRSDLNFQIKENREAVSRLNSGVASLQNEIHRYQEQDLKGYIRDFYYG
jgi:DNA anti-recombination protein RmuC